MICSTVRTGFAPIRERWQGLLDARAAGTIFLTPTWQETWWDHFGAESELFLLDVTYGDGKHGIAPLALRDHTLTFLGKTDLFDYHDFLDGDFTFYEALLECIDEEPWRVMDLRSLPESSMALNSLPDLARQRGWSVQMEQEDVVPGLPLPGSWDDYLVGLRKKDRHELRRKLRRLHNAGDAQMVTGGGERLDEDLDLFLDMMGESRDEKREFLSPERESFLRDMAHRIQDAGHLRLFFLELNGERVAAALCFDYNGHRLLYNSGFRRAQAALSVSLMLKAMTINDAIEQEMKYYDFLRGHESYKYHLGAHDTAIYRLVVERAG